MNKRIYFCTFFICLIFFASCNRDFSALNALDQNPVWLTQLISKIENENSYYGAIIYRHLWNSQYYYHLMIPFDSCAYCKVYNMHGNIVQWTDKSFQDYLQHRRSEVIVWEWEKN